MLGIFILAAPAFIIRYYIGRPVPRLYAIAGIGIPYALTALAKLSTDPQASTSILSAAAVVAYFTLRMGDKETDPSNLPAISIDEILGQMWRYDRSDLSEYEDMEWMCAHTGDEYRLGNSKVFLNGSGKRLLVRPPSLDSFSVVRISGLFNQKIVTEEKGPSKKELRENLQGMVEAGVVPSDISIP